MPCNYLRKICPGGSGCDNYVCRAYFPERQTYVKEDMLEFCQSEEYVECPRFIEGRQIRLQKKQDALAIHCPFASNTRCGRPWEWWCKGGNYPFLLTTFKVREGTDDIPLRDENGEIQFTYDEELLNNTCFSGKTEVYEECPNYKLGVEVREYVNQLKKQEKENIGE